MHNLKEIPVELLETTGFFSAVKDQKNFFLTCKTLYRKGYQLANQWFLQSAIPCNTYLLYWFPALMDNLYIRVFMTAFEGLLDFHQERFLCAEEMIPPGLRRYSIENLFEILPKSERLTEVRREWEGNKDLYKKILTHLFATPDYIDRSYFIVSDFIFTTVRKNEHQQLIIYLLGHGEADCWAVKTYKILQQALGKMDLIVLPDDNLEKYFFQRAFEGVMVFNVLDLLFDIRYDSANFHLARLLLERQPALSEVAFHATGYSCLGLAINWGNHALVDYMVKNGYDRIVIKKYILHDEHGYEETLMSSPLENAMKALIDEHDRFDNPYRAVSIESKINIINLLMESELAHAPEDYTHISREEYLLSKTNLSPEKIKIMQEIIEQHDNQSRILNNSCVIF